MTLVSRMRDKHTCAVIEHCRENTEIVVNTENDFVILKGELLVSGPDRPKMCDCVIFRDDQKVVMAELKSRTSRRSSLLEKFANTARCFAPSSNPQSRPSLSFTWF